MILKSYTTHDVETLAKTGVYAIVNKVNHKFYIGSATQVGKFPSQSGFNSRFYIHIHRLNKSTHHCPHLQSSWNKYGGENFEFQIIHLCPPEEAIEFEQLYINLLCPHYNASPTAGSSRGVKRSKECRELLSTSKGIPFKVVDPEGNLIEQTNLVKFCRDNNLVHHDMHCVIKNKSLHHKGWTHSLQHHKLFKDLEKVRGISFETSRKRWRVSWLDNFGIRQVKRFKTLNEAISYRDNIEKDLNLPIRTTLVGWKEKLVEYAE